MRRTLLATLGSMTLFACGAGDPPVQNRSEGDQAPRATAQSVDSWRPLRGPYDVTSGVMLVDGGTPPARFMLDEQGYITAVKDQRGRGSCTYFATVGAIESEYKRQFGLTLDLSEEYMINMLNELSPPDWVGGDVSRKLTITSFYGLPPTSVFPYVGSTSTILSAEGTSFGGIDMSSAQGKALYSTFDFNSSTFNVLNSDLANFSTLIAPPPAAHAAAVYGPWPGSIGQISVSGTATAPIERAIAEGHPVAFQTTLATWWPNPQGATAPPSGGSYQLNTSLQPPYGPVDHAMLIVGYDSTKRLFRVKNSWGATWNGNGFADASYDLVMATITDPTYVVVLRDPNVSLGTGTGALRGFWAGVLDGQPGVAVLHHGFANPGEAYEVSPDTGYFYANNGQTYALEWQDGSYDTATLGVVGEPNVSQIQVSGGPDSWSYVARSPSGRTVESGTWCRTSRRSPVGVPDGGPPPFSVPSSYAAAVNDPYAFPPGACVPQGGGGHKVAPFVRHDGVNSVMHYYGGYLSELSLAKGAAHWTLSDMNAVLPGMHLPSGGPISAYVRADGVDSVNFMDNLGERNEMYLTSGGWFASFFAGDTPFFGDHAYTRDDGVSTVVFSSAATGDLMEARLTSSGWTDGDLHTVGGAATARPGVPFGWVRSDGTSSVVYAGSDGNLYETALVAGASSWTTGNLSRAAGAPVLPAGDASAYVRSDRVNAVVYRGTDTNVYELSLAPGKSWVTGNLNAACGVDGTPPPSVETDPIGFVRADRTNAVYVASSNGHVWEMALTANGWACADLTARAGAPAMDLAAGSLAPYVRADGVSAVVFLGTDGHVWELSLPGSSWASKDLTSDALSAH